MNISETTNGQATKRKDIYNDDNNKRLPHIDRKAATCDNKG